jgi:hypothetical protein
LKRKRDAYISALKVKEGTLEINCEHIKSYWATPGFRKDLTIRVRVVPNGLRLEDFFTKLESSLNEAYRGKTRINDIVDLYHLHSLYHDASLHEVWSCNQQFVRRHERHLRMTPGFAELFDKSQVKVMRIK